jgi:hypothetical protein
MGLFSSLKKLVKAILPVVSPVTALFIEVGKLIDKSTSGSSTKGKIPGPWVVPTNDNGIVLAIADVLQKQPSNIIPSHHDRCIWVADYLRVGVRTATRPPPASVKSNAKAGRSIFNNMTMIHMNKGVWNRGVNPAGSLTNPATKGDDSLTARANQAQANVLALSEKAIEFSGLARAAGFDPPDNPFIAIATLNANRKPPFTDFNLDSTYASDLVFNIKAYIDLLDAYNQGAINLETGTIDTAQLSHVTLSFNGLGGTGNTAADIKSFLPSIDAIKKEAARKALEALDFSKRVPTMLFTLDYAPDDKPQGTLVGWKKIPDASGYVVSRRAVFSGQELEWDLPSESIVEKSKAYIPYVQTFALSFIGSIDSKSVLAINDQSINPHEYYIYKVKAYQVRSDNQSKVFSNDWSPVSLTSAAIQSIEHNIRVMSDWPDFTITGWDSSGNPIKTYNNFQETISPWPAFAEYILGDSTLDWVLAAMNTRAAIERKEPRQSVRSYSYLNANSGYLFAMAGASKLVAPVDKNKVASEIESSIQKMGVSQVIQLLLDETGITYYFDGRDPAEDTIFHRAGKDTAPGNTGLFSAVASAIDPETATLDLSSLSSNMSVLLAAQNLGVNTTLDSPSSNGSKPGQIAVPDPDEATNVSAEGPLQFISKLGDLRDSTADLTTFDGISKLMRALRIMSDFGPNRVPPKQAPSDVQKPVEVPPPVKEEPRNTEEIPNTKMAVDVTTGQEYVVYLNGTDENGNPYYSATPPGFVDNAG